MGDRAKECSIELSSFPPTKAQRVGGEGPVPGPWIQAVRRSTRPPATSASANEVAAESSRVGTRGTAASRASICSTSGKRTFFARWEACVKSPATDALVLSCILPQLTVFLNSVWSSNVNVLEDTYHQSRVIIAATFWLFTLYLISRVLMRDRGDSLGINVAIFVVLLLGESAVRMRFLAKERGKILGLPQGSWTVVITICIVILLILVPIRCYITCTMILNAGRRLVSQKRRRFVDEGLGVDLDLSYVTPNVIAMGWPTESWSEQLRNPINQVVMVLNKRHSGRYKVYNLCSERRYREQYFEREFHEIRFLDHNVCRLVEVQAICRDMKAFLGNLREKRVVVVHCKAGKGRTGMIVSCLLLHLRKHLRAESALAHFAKRRTYNGKGVTIPSQVRWVRHYEALIREGGLRPSRNLRLARIETRPPLEECIRFQLVHPDDGVIFDSLLSRHRPPILEGDFKLVSFHEQNKLFQAWLHTAYDVTERCDQAPPEMLQPPCCHDGHTMEQIVAYTSKRCDRCNQVIYRFHRAFECRVCDPIVWRCCKCSHETAQNHLRGVTSALRLAKQLAGRVRERREERRQWTAFPTMQVLRSSANSASSVASSLFFFKRRSVEQDLGEDGATNGAESPASPSRTASSDGWKAEAPICCPRGHPLQSLDPEPPPPHSAGRARASSSSASSARPRFGTPVSFAVDGRAVWACSVCGKRSWEQERARSHRCSKCNYSACDDCYRICSLSLRSEEEERWSLLWQDTHVRSATKSKAFVQTLGRHELDGPHKQADGESPARQAIAHLREVRLTFHELDDAEIAMEEECTAEGSYFSDFQAEESLESSAMAKDYDALADDTDNEESLGVVCRGFLLRYRPRLCCAPPQLRLAELDKDGRFHIAGGRMLGAINTQIAGDSACFEESLSAASFGGATSSADPLSASTVGRARTWWVRNPHMWWAWERLQAPTAEEEVRWDEGFTDVLRSREPLRTGELFNDFFHIASGEVDPTREVSILTDDWRLRLLTLQDDGRLFMYSHGDSVDMPLCATVVWPGEEQEAGSAGSGGGGEGAATGRSRGSSDSGGPREAITRLAARLSGGQNDDFVLFQVPAVAGPKGKLFTLAASVETFSRLRSKVVGIVEKASGIFGAARSGATSALEGASVVCV